MNIPDNYKVLFLQGGASTAVCNDTYEFNEKQKLQTTLLTGQWAKKAICRKHSKYGKGKRRLQLQKTRHSLTYRIVQICQ